MRRFDHIAIGLLLGLLAPIIGLFIYYLFTYHSQTSFNGFLQYYSALNIIVASLSLACYATNLPLFFFFIWKEKMQNARGVLLATVMYTAWVVYEKFLA